MSKINFETQFFTPAKLPDRVGQNPAVIDLNFFGLNSFMKRLSERVGRLDSVTRIITQTISGAANPSSLVELGVNNGVANTYMRSDAAPALSQSISPTWTATHTFNSPPTFVNSAKLLGPGTDVSQAVFTNATHDLVTVATTGSGNVVLSSGPTLTGTINAANQTLSGTLSVTGTSTFTAKPIMSSLTASLPVFSDASNGLVSNAMTGTGNVVMSASPTFTGTITAAIANFSGAVTFGTYLGQSSITTLGTISTGVWNGTTIAVANGGTGAVTLASNGVLYGNGTSAIQALAVNSSATNKFLTQLSSGVPSWAIIAASDLPTITLSGDVSGSGSGGTIASIAIGSNKVTNAMIRTSSGLSVIGRSTNTTGNVADITGTDGQVLRVSGTTLGFGTVVAAGIASNAVTTVKILDSNVTLAKIANIAGTTFLGNFSESPAAPQALSITDSKSILGISLVENTALSTWAGTTNITTLGTVTTGIWSGTSISTTKGGTGLSTYTLGDIIYSSAANTLSALSGNTTSSIKVLAQTGTGSVSAAPAWNAATGTGNVVFSAAPTFTGTITAASLNLSGNLSVTGTSAVGIAAVASQGFTVRTSTLTSTIQYGIVSDSVLNSSATTAGNAIYAQLRTAAASFTMTNGFSVYIDSPIVGSGSTVTSLYGINVQDISGGGTNYAFRSGAGFVRFGDVVSIGVIPLSSVAFTINNTSLTGTNQYGIDSHSVFTSAATASGNAIYSQLRTAASAFTMANAFAVYIDSPVIGSGSAVTNMYGLNIQDITGGTSQNYAIRTGLGKVRFGDSVQLDAALTSAGSSGGYNESSFTATVTGVSGTVTGTVNYVRVGKHVIMRLPFLTGTSNSTSFGISGIPTELRPGTQQYLILPFGTDASTPASTYIEMLIKTDGTAAFNIGPSGLVWTAAGTKSIGITGSEQAVAYAL